MIANDEILNALFWGFLIVPFVLGYIAGKQR